MQRLRDVDEQLGAALAYGWPLPHSGNFSVGCRLLRAVLDMHERGAEGGESGPCWRYLARDAHEEPEDVR